MRILATFIWIVVTLQALFIRPARHRHWLIFCLLVGYISFSAPWKPAPTMIRPQWVLFGDSITQRGFSPNGWAGLLADAYQRRIDIVNRGYSGFNTKWAVPLLDRVFPAQSKDSVQLATVFFGANDAALPDATSYVSAPLTAQSHLHAHKRHLCCARTLMHDGAAMEASRLSGTPLRSQPALGTLHCTVPQCELTLHAPPPRRSKQHVPLAEYTQNVRAIVGHLQKLSVPAIVLITPPPVSELHRIKYVLALYGVHMEKAERTNEAAGQYAAACRALGAELDLPVVDLWSAFQEMEDWAERLLNDGLHLTEEGDALVAELLTKQVQQRWPALTPEAMRWDVPEWSDLAEAADAQELLTAHFAQQA